MNNTTSDRESETNLSKMDSTNSDQMDRESSENNEDLIEDIYAKFSGLGEGDTINELGRYLIEKFPQSLAANLYKENPYSLDYFQAITELIHEKFGMTQQEFVNKLMNAGPTNELDHLPLVVSDLSATSRWMPDFLPETEEFVNDYIEDGYLYLKNYFRIPEAIIKDLKSTVQKQNYVLYRGLNFKEKSKDFQQLVDTLMQHSSVIKSGQTLNITINNSISSWTTDLGIARKFSEWSGNPYSIILQSNVSYKDVVADLTSLNKYEKEILLKPGQYLVVIHSIYKRGEPVESLGDWDREISIDEEFQNNSDEDDHDDDKTINIHNWKQVGKQLGSNPGGVFEDEEGERWYCKFPQNKDIVDNEILANLLYSAAKISVPDIEKIQLGGEFGVASRIVDGKNDVEKLTSGKLKGLYEGFAVDAWLANWDVVGTNYENLLVRERPVKRMVESQLVRSVEYDVVRIDTGGALLYRAQGQPKGRLFKDHVDEIKTFLDKGVNYWTWSVFKDIAPQDIKMSIKRIGKITDDKISSLVNKYGPGDDREKARLIQKLISRKRDLLVYL